jgi:hypothetical protein
VREAEEFLRVNKWPATPGVPGSPVGVVGNGQVSLTWSAPTLGSPPTDYQVQYSSNSGSTWTTFADGTSTATSAVVTGLTNGTGYIFRVRAVNALGEGPYGAASGTITPAGINAALLLRFDGTNGSTTFTDSSSNALTVTASGNAVISTAQSKFGGASGYFDGNPSTRLVVADSSASDFQFDADFTVESWVYRTSVAEFQTIISRITGTENGWILRFQGLNTLTWYSGDPFSTVHTFGATINLNQWHHVAVCRSGGVLRAFLNGSQIGADQQNSDLHGGGSACAVGGNRFPGFEHSFSGYIDDLRIVKGFAVYTANFTPPTAPF